MTDNGERELFGYIVALARHGQPCQAAATLRAHRPGMRLLDACRVINNLVPGSFPAVAFLGDGRLS